MVLQETKGYNLNGNNSDLFGNAIERIHSVSIKENKEKDDGFSTYYFETIFTNQEGYTFKFIAPKVRFKEYSMTEDYDDYYVYGSYNKPAVLQSCAVTETNIELLLKVLKKDNSNVKYELIDITKYHKMTLKEVEKELGYKIKLIEK